MKCLCIQADRDREQESCVWVVPNPLD